MLYRLWLLSALKATKSLELAKTDNINIRELLIDTVFDILDQRRAKQCYTSMSLYG